VAAAQVIQSRAVNNNFEGNDKYYEFLLVTTLKETVEIIHEL
jgi:hypothetical protein